MSDIHPPRALYRRLKLWFGLSELIDARTYATQGFVLMVFKYLVEAMVLFAATGRFVPAPAFFDPFLTRRLETLAPAPLWLGWAQFLWTLPFLWIAVSMSVRRAADAGYSPWYGLFVVVPLVNYLVMIGLCLARSKPNAGWSGAATPPVFDEQIQSGVRAIVVSLVVGLALLAFSVNFLESYGAVLFVATPLVTGAISGYVHNLRHSRSVSSTLTVSFLSLACAGVAMLLFALEGAICVAMAAPLAIPFGMLGGLIGKAIADHSTAGRGQMSSALCIFPLLAMPEAFCARPRIHEVQSYVVIDAAPEAVWANTVAFPEIDPPSEWYFRAGIAHPTAAHIDRLGPDGTRYCVFSTGEFVEPIRAWEPPLRLAFDVNHQPEPMRELSPYRIHPPHLHGYMTSRKGEFRLVPLDDGRTRLEGRTWYELAMFPESYWTLWSDAIVHRIHLRVLNHIKRISES